MSGSGDQGGRQPQAASPRPSSLPRGRTIESGPYPPVSPALRAAAFGPPGRAAFCGADPAGARFADLMATVPNGVGIFDRTGRLVEANPALCRLLGAPPDVLRGVPAVRLSTDGAPGPLPSWLRPVPPGDAHGYRVEAAGLLRPDGSCVLCRLDVTVSSAPDGGPVWLVVCTDVGDRPRVAESRCAADTISSAEAEAADRGSGLEAELRAAIAEDTLVLEYQPVVAPDGRVTSAEALVRWPHPERGVIPPAEFLPVVARAGLARELDLWVLRAAVREAAEWPREVAVAVNLAGLLPGDPCFLRTVSEIVSAGGLPWNRLVLELVETGIVELSGQALGAMAELAGRGARFAVDDFGTGYSSLARLKELPVKTVKVDRAFVVGVATDPADFAVARAVVDMAKALGRTTVAEGVETVEQFHVLRGLGVDAYQGWLFSRPLAAGQLRELLAARRLPTPARAASLALQTLSVGNQRSQIVSVDG